MSYLQEKEDFGVHENDILCGKLCKYQVLNLTGEGSFGKVARCVKLDTKEKVAVKIVRKNLTWAGKKEASAFKTTSILDLNKINVVKFFESFTHKGHMCLVLEMLDKNLHDLMRERSGRPLCLSEIRVVSQQMLVALSALKSIGLVHADIKPDNVMLVNHELQPFRVKLIDFGYTTLVSKVQHGSTIQALGYRAPEVVLGLPMNEAIDMWALGCVIVFMYLTQHLYPIKCEYETIRIIMQMQGQPEDRLLNAGIHTKKFFSKYKYSTRRVWRFKTRSEYTLATGQETKQCKAVSNKYTCVDDMTKDHPESRTVTEYEDTQAFLSLIKRMLHVDSVRRITPTEALGHRFITMRHFPRDAVSDPYVTSSRANMNVCPPQDSPVGTCCFVTSSEISHGGAPSSLPAAQIPGYSKEVIHGSDEGTTCFVTVKARKMTLRRILGFFSRMMRAVCC